MSVFGVQAFQMCRRRAILYAFHAQCRAMSAQAAAAESLRERLTNELKTSMKARNTTTSTVLRSVLSEVYSEDKKNEDGSKIPDTIIEKIMQKGVLKRTEAATQFKQAARPDLAEKELVEVNLLQAFLPPMPTEADIDRVLRETITEDNISVGDSKKALGSLFKGFYSRISRESVDPELVKRKANALLGV